MLGKRVLDLGREDVLAAGDDHVLDPVDHVQEAGLVEAAGIAGVHPAVLQSLGGFLGLVPVALHDGRAAHGDLAHLAGGAFVALGIDDADLGGGDGAAGGAHLGRLGVGDVILRGKHGDDGGAFGLAVDLQEARFGEGAHGAAEQRDIDGGRAIADRAEGRDIAGGHVGMFDEAAQHDRDEEDVADALGLDQAEHLARVEGGDGDLGRAAKGELEDDGQPADMEERRHVQARGVAAVIGRRGQAQRVGIHVAVAEHDALGGAGGAAGVEDRREVVVVAHGVGHRIGAGDQRFEIVRAGDLGLAQPDDRELDIGPGAQVFDQRGEIVVDDEEAGVAVIEGIGDLGHAPAGVDGVQDAAGPEGGEDVFEIAVGIGGEHADPVAGFHSKARQPSGQPCDTVGEDGIGLPSVAVDREQVARPFSAGLVQRLCQVHGILPSGPT